MMWRCSASPLSPWWWLPVAVGAVALVPTALAYWLAPPRASTLDHPRASIPVWLFALAAATSALGVPPLRPYAPLAVLLLLLAWAAQETVRWRTKARLALRGDIARNRLTRAVGESLRLVAIFAGWVALDTLARHAAVTGVLADGDGGYGRHYSGLADVARARGKSGARRGRVAFRDHSVAPPARSNRSRVRPARVLAAPRSTLLVHSAFESSRALRELAVARGARALARRSGQTMDLPTTRYRSRRCPPRAWAARSLGRRTRSACAGEPADRGLLRSAGGGYRGRLDPAMTTESTEIRRTAASESDACVRRDRSTHASARHVAHSTRRLWMSVIERRNPASATGSTRCGCATPVDSGVRRGGRGRLRPSRGGADPGSFHVLAA